MKNEATVDLVAAGTATAARRTYYCLACSREMGVMTRAAYEAAGEECGECEPWTSVAE